MEATDLAKLIGKELQTMISLRWKVNQWAKHWEQTLLQRCRRGESEQVGSLQWRWKPVEVVQEGALSQEPRQLPPVVAVEEQQLEESETGAEEGVPEMSEEPCTDDPVLPQSPRFEETSWTTTGTKKQQLAMKVRVSMALANQEQEGLKEEMAAKTFQQAWQKWRAKQQMRGFKVDLKDHGFPRDTSPLLVPSRSQSCKKLTRQQEQEDENLLQAAICEARKEEEEVRQSTDEKHEIAQGKKLPKAARQSAAEGDLELLQAAIEAAHTEGELLEALAMATEQQVAPSITKPRVRKRLKQMARAPPSWLLRRPRGVETAGSHGRQLVNLAEASPHDNNGDQEEGRYSIEQSC